MTHQMTRLNIVVRAETREAFLATYTRDFLQRGMFVRTNNPFPLEPGTRVRFRMLLTSGRLLLSGVGVVSWVASHADRGFGLQFVDLSQPAERFHRQMRRRRRESEEYVTYTALDEFCEAPTCPAVRRRHAMPPPPLPPLA